MSGLEATLRAINEVDGPEPQCESTQGLVFSIIIPFPLVPIPVPAILSVYTNIFLTDCATKPLHHTPYKREHFVTRLRQQAYGKLESGVVPMLIEEHKKLENSCTSVTRHEE